MGLRYSNRVCSKIIGILDSEPSKISLLQCSAMQYFGIKLLTRFVAETGCRTKNYKDGLEKELKRRFGIKTTLNGIKTTSTGIRTMKTVWNKNYKDVWNKDYINKSVQNSSSLTLNFEYEKKKLKHNN